MPLPSLRGHKEAQASAPQAPKSLLPDNTPLEFLVLLSACNASWEQRTRKARGAALAGLEKENV